jgi:hypothetical protein
LLHDIVLQRGSMVRGFVFDADGKPARAARVWIGMDADVANTPSVLAHDDGAFTFAHVPPGEQRVGARLAGRPSVQRGVVVPADPPHLDGIELRFERGHVLAGIVRDVDGRPIAGASVLTRRNPSNYDVYTKSDEKGRFRLEAVPAETTLVEAYAAGFESAQLHDVARPRGPRLVMARGGGLAGTVIDAATGAPLGSFASACDAARGRGERGGATDRRSGTRGGLPRNEGIWTSQARRCRCIRSSASRRAPAATRRATTSTSSRASPIRQRSCCGSAAERASRTSRRSARRAIAGAFVKLSIGGSREILRGEGGDPLGVARAATGPSRSRGRPRARWLTVTPRLPAHEDGPFTIAAAGSQAPVALRAAGDRWCGIGDGGRPSRAPGSSF